SVRLWCAAPRTYERVLLWSANRMTRSCILLFLLGLAVPGYGQSNYALLTGTITDSQLLPVAGAAVELKAVSTGAIRRVVTNQRGLFEAPALLPDDYQVKVEASG